MKSISETRVGDGIVTRLDKRRGIVLALYRDQYTDELAEVLVRYIDRKGGEGTVLVQNYRLETFFEFCTRRTGFGKTPWPQFAVIMGFVLVIAIAGLVSGREEPTAATVALGFVLAVPATMLFGTWQNYRGRWV